MTGLDLRPDENADPTRMRRNDVIVVRLWFEPTYDLQVDELLCDVKSVPDGALAASWTFAVDTDPPDPTTDPSLQGLVDADGDPVTVTAEWSSALWSVDATDLYGPYRYDVQDGTGNTLFASDLFVDPDVTEVVTP